MSEAEPRMTISGFTPAVERSRHQELSVSRRMNQTSVQLALYSDHLTNTALTGVGDASANFGDVLPDVYSGTFSYRGAALNTNGLRLVVQQKLPSDLTATLAYGYGGYNDYGDFDGNRSFDPDKWNDWWHDRPDRAFPRWVWNNQNCAPDRMWSSGSGWRCTP